MRGPTETCAGWPNPASPGSGWIVGMDTLDLWRRGTGGYHTYRIPALVRTGTGALLAFCEGRLGGAGDAGEIHVLLRRSEDDGRTWSQEQVVAGRPGYTRGNPAPVLDAVTGVIHLLITENPADKDETAICAGDGLRRVYRSHSADDGRGWSEPVELTEQVKRPDWTWYATGPCHGVQLRSGRLVVACDHIVGENRDRWTDPYHSHVCYSDDHGATWRIGGVLDRGTNESTVAELGDGRVYLNARQHLDRGMRAYAYSDDGGESFGPTRFHPALPEPTCQASVIGDRAKGLLLFANPASKRRERLTVRASADGGATWNAGVVLHEGPAAYSDLAVGEEYAWCLYECGDDGPYETLRLARFAIDDVARRP